MSITIVAILIAQEGCESKLNDLCINVIEPTLKEEGSLNYHLYIDQDNPKRFTFIEEWKSKEDLEKHLSTSYIQDLFFHLKDLIESSEIIHLSKIK